MADDDFPEVTGLVLAAGLGRRMGGPKAELVVDGERLMDRAVRLLEEAGCDPVIVVGQASFAYPEALVFHNEDPEDGLRSSLQIGVEAADGCGPGIVAVMLVDQPGLTVEGTRSVVSAWRPGRVSVGTIEGRRVHPVVMAIDEWHEALSLAGPDEGARRFLASHPDLVDEIEVPGVATDLDTPEDLRRFVESRLP
ncbi:NTP transferase domain-containing protein [Nocardioides sp. Kera G14]|uniref:nucleotidyltransferase family protein n=1 Tax=Nocardioides sp. Kera G14 TaxID=2884264 RepID=UPI001D107D66|nr:nucleotidyltransferase family protein [Nocardioides sp. Kera G14]UDY23332.1 nucleotidyltransferase family protein [Nocardioides sp. Kera G14]